MHLSGMILALLVLATSMSPNVGGQLPRRCTAPKSSRTLDLQLIPSDSTIKQLVFGHKLLQSILWTLVSNQTCSKTQIHDI